MSSPTTSCISASFPPPGDAPGHLLRLFDGELPAEKTARKKQKPDLEAITQLPPFGRFANGALLALGSGSKKNRRRGALLALDAPGAIAARRGIVDVAPLFDELDRRFPRAEHRRRGRDRRRTAAAAARQRKHPQNLIVRYPLAPVLDALAAGDVIGAIAPSAIDRRSRTDRRRAA